MLGAKHIITERREQFHDNDFSANRKDIGYNLNNILQNMDRAVNTFHRLNHALLQVCINMSAPSHKTLTPMYIFTKTNKKFDVGNTPEQINDCFTFSSADTRLEFYKIRVSSFEKISI